MDSWNHTSPPLWWYNFTYPNFIIPTLPDFDTGALPLTEVTNPVLEKITFAVRVFLFITCLVENSIAVFILCKSVRNAGRKTFAQHMLISIACADILTALVYYPGVFALQGRIGDILCKLPYNFLVNLPGKVLSLSLIGLACDAARNSSLKGRKEHTKKFSIIVTTLLWIAATGFSAVYLGIGKGQSSFQFNECRPTELAASMLNLVFVVSADIILAILSFVVFIQVKRRGGEMKERNRQEREMARLHSKTGSYREIIHHNGRESCAEERVMETSNSWELQSMGSEINDVEPQDSENVTGQSAEEERFQTTRNEAKITGAVSFPFIILSITTLIFPLICFSCSMYVSYAVQMAGEIFAAIKPAIYACADKEFRKRYKLLSPFACCCFRRVRCHTTVQVGVQEVEMRH